MLRYLTKDNESGSRVRAIGGNVTSRDAKSIDGEFRVPRDQFGVHGGDGYHHASVNFDPRDLGSLVTPEGTPDVLKLARVGEEWAERNGIAARHQYVVVVHGDKVHPHIHVLWSSVSLVDGKKWHSDRAFLEKARDTTDFISREHGVRDLPERTRNFDRPPEKVMRAVARGADPYSWKVDLRIRISDAARSAVDESDFANKLRQREVNLRRRGEGYSFAFRDPSGKLRVARARRLGEEYQRGPLLERFEGQRRELLRDPSGLEAVARRLKDDKGHPLRSWRAEFRMVIAEARSASTSMEDYQRRLAGKGIELVRTDSGLKYVSPGPNGTVREIWDRALGPAYSESRLASRFTDNRVFDCRSAAPELALKSATRLGGMADGLIRQITRESNPNHEFVHEPPPESEHERHRKSQSRLERR